MHIARSTSLLPRNAWWSLRFGRLATLEWAKLTCTKSTKVSVEKTCSVTIGSSNKKTCPFVVVVVVATQRFFMFTPTLGKMMQVDEHNYIVVVQMGWSWNHQLVVFFLSMFLICVSSFWYPDYIFRVCVSQGGWNFLEGTWHPSNPRFKDLLWMFYSENL